MLRPLLICMSEMKSPFLVLLLSACLMASETALAADTYCADGSRLEFLAGDVIVETDHEGRRTIWVDSGGLGTGIAGRLFSTLSGDKMGVNVPDDEGNDTLIIVRDGKDASYRPCTTPAQADKSEQKLWVEVTRPMIACGSVQDDATLRQSIVNLYPLWLKDPSANAPDCRPLEVGQVLLVDDEQTEADRQVVLRLWEPVCPKGCSPAMTPIYAPPRRAVGAYLRPISPPEEWR